MIDIHKNTFEILRIERKQYRGKDVVDMRVWAIGDQPGTEVPTKKGVTVRPELVPEIVKALQGLDTEPEL
jgi:hypothetical protein